VNIVDAIRHPDLFGPHFRDQETWAAWITYFRALFGLPMNTDERTIYEKCTGREDAPPEEGFTETWLVVGRRGGKSFALALVAVFFALFRDWSRVLAPGEVATVMILAADRKQARVIFRFVRGLIRSTPLLDQEVVRATEDFIQLSNHVAVEVHTASFRTVRGYTVVAALCDEIAFWRAEESANPDREILNALRPAMATVPGALLLCASSPYAQRGVLYDAFRRYHGSDGAPVLVWRADTRTMNPTVPKEVVDEAYEQDPDAAAAEYGAEFRRDVADFISRGAVEDCVDRGVRERPYRAGRRYVAFTDPSGGSRDSFTLAVAHREKDRVVLDALREVRPPFSPEGVVGEFSDLVRGYGLSRVRGDRYAGEWPREAFRRHGLTYEPSMKPKSDIYVDLLPLVNSGRAGLLDDPRLVHQLASPERRTSRSGRDSVDHPPGGHDDVANAAAGALTMLDRSPAIFRTFRIKGF